METEEEKEQPMSDSFKQKGNQFFKEKHYERAIEQYTKAIVS